MTIKRLRELPSPEQLAAMYPTPHDHSLYGAGHGERVARTIQLAMRTLDVECDSVADFSCGNGAIALALGYSVTLLGDLAPGYDVCGPLEETLLGLEWVDVYVCSETLEHVDDPQLVLSLVRPRAAYCVVSTPIDCWEDTNGEHLWAWDREGVEWLMSETGWQSVAFDRVETAEYTYGVWVAT